MVVEWFCSLISRQRKKKTFPSGEERLALVKRLGSWVYAVLSRLELPLHVSSGGAIRMLLKKCSKRRAELVCETLALSYQSLPFHCHSVQNSPSSSELAVLNVLIVLAGNFFKQGLGGEEHW